MTGKIFEKQIKKSLIKRACSSIQNINKYAFVCVCMCLNSIFFTRFGAMRARNGESTTTTTTKKGTKASEKLVTESLN